LVRMLRDLSENCIIFIDRDATLAREFFEELNMWPVKYRKPAKELLTRLRRYNRLIKMAPSSLLKKGCSFPSCHIGVTTAEAARTDAVVACDQCQPCASSQLVVSVVSVSDYHTSSFCSERSRLLQVRAANGEIHDQAFEQRVLRPLFAFAKQVRIYDRYIGRSIPPAPGSGNRLDVLLGERYRRSLEWLARCLAHSTQHETPPDLFIYCGVQAWRFPRESVYLSVSELRTFAESLNEKYGLRVTVVFKEEAPGREMMHARYLITDQIGVLIERGVDLLWTNAEMHRASLSPGRDPRPLRDFAVFYCDSDDSHQIEKEMRHLPDLVLDA